MTWRIICDNEEVALECLRAARRIQLQCEPEIAVDIVKALDQSSEVAPSVALALVTPPPMQTLVELAELARKAAVGLPMALICESTEAQLVRAAALGLGITAVPEVDPLLAAVALLGTGARTPWRASCRGLPEADRNRLRSATEGFAVRTDAPKLVRGDLGMLSWRRDAKVHALGPARDVAVATKMLESTDRDSPRVESIVDGVDTDAVTNVLFGPRRALSDPASKAALVPYGIPIPEEELCASASRAAAEAARIGYPVRISLASPDLRIWDHPDLAVDMVDNAARVRDCFRQLLGLARTRLPERTDAERRLLGVTVTATSEAIALLWLDARPLSGGTVSLDIGFADPHGDAAADCTRLVLPATEMSIERSLLRLRGSALLLGGNASRRKTHREALADVLLRLCAFASEHRREIENVTIRPLALLVDGSVEVREACVSVSDAFARSLESTG